MTYNPEIHHRRSIRAKRYDYSHPGSYFVTICTWERASVLGAVVDGEMRPNEIGASVHDVWRALPERFPGIALDAFVVMPNHVHGIVMLGAAPSHAGFATPVGAGLALSGPPAPALPAAGHVGNTIGGWTDATDGNAVGDHARRHRNAAVGGPGRASPAPTGLRDATTPVGDIPPTVGAGLALPSPPASTSPGAGHMRNTTDPHTGTADADRARYHRNSAAGEPGRASPAPTGVAPSTSGVSTRRPVTLGAVVGAFKSLSAIGANRLLGRSGAPFWQRNYYDHIIRTDIAFDRIRAYIENNPANWTTDEENPLCKG